LSYGGNARSASNRESTTALHVAAEFGNLVFLKLLSDYGADINAVNDERETPLGVAIKHKKQSAVDFLKQKGGH
jgi:ankyrin repeat protein